MKEMEKRNNNNGIAMNALLSSSTEQKFAILSLFVISASSLCGYMCFQVIVEKRTKHLNYGTRTHGGHAEHSSIPNHETNGNYISLQRPKSEKQAYLEAMIQNAKSSSWRENLKNASNAQQMFMLPGRRPDEQHEVFLEKIGHEKERIMEMQQRDNAEQRWNDTKP
eukprot:CAMPEP_0195540964 /NCGR_PEP_ID=MMETSP0794_2-20130614/50845_1 /TAXON_ID=515487 /ORGANISM="Stephanopyxis turris, Strain CCMP 815" /LENGTH=165 /DNA_ID=CAMNT_0040675047 /DNA_START=7 /DNA_END=504 /DNA_ORIENTATION=+